MTKTNESYQATSTNPEQVQQLEALRATLLLNHEAVKLVGKTTRFMKKRAATAKRAERWRSLFV